MAKAEKESPTEIARKDYPPQKITLTIGGMTCAACVHHVKAALESVKGVLETNVNLATERATVQLKSEDIIGDLRYAVENAGYSVLGTSTDEANEQVTPHELARVKHKLVFSVAVSAIIMVTMAVPALKTPIPFRVDFLLMTLATPVQFWAGWQFYVSAWSALKHRTSNMNTLIAMGTSVAFTYSVIVTLFHNTFLLPNYEFGTYFDTSTAIISLVLLGRYLEARAKKRAARAIKRLMELQPQNARVLRKDKEHNIPIEDVTIGDIVITKPGEKVAVDGKVITGSSWIDESMLTGESMPVPKGVGDDVSAGTINGNSSLTFCASKVGRNTAIQRIIQMVEEAQGSRAPIQRTADTVAKYFVPTIILGAVTVFIIWIFLAPAPSYLYAMLTSVCVLIIACPCAMGLATPTAIMVGTGVGAENGILIRSAEALEETHRIETIVLDKTGTLTAGKLTVSDVISDAMSEHEILQIAASAERRSEHPIGEALVSSASERNLTLAEAHDFKTVTGYGIEATVYNSKIVVGNLTFLLEKGVRMNGLASRASGLLKQNKMTAFVAVDGKAIGLIGLTDTIKPGTKEALAAIQKRGLEVVMITGDQYLPAKIIANELGIKKFIANVPPADKAYRVKAMQSGGKIVAMVGDGINDSPALAQANVGIAMGTGTDVAIETADVTLVKGNIWSVVAAIELSKATMRTVKQNLFWAFAYNVALIPIAAGILYPLFSSKGVPEWIMPVFGEFGLLNPILAAAAMAFSSVTVVSNSLRLRKFNPSRKTVPASTEQ